MTVTTLRETTARYYVAKGDSIEHYTEAEFPADYVVFHGAGATVADNRVLCEITPTVHMVLDRADVELS